IVAVQVPSYSGAPVAEEIPVTLVRNLGARNLPTTSDFQFEYALTKYGFDQPIPPHVEESALKAPPGLEEPSPTDFGNTPFVTIDGDSTLDVDDAVFGE